MRDRYAAAFSNCVSDHSIFSTQLGAQSKSDYACRTKHPCNPILEGRAASAAIRSRSIDEIRKEDLCPHKMDNMSDYCGGTCGANDQFSSQDITFILQKNVRYLEK